MGFFSRLFRLDPDQKASQFTPSTAGATDLALDARTAQAVLDELDIDTAIEAHENWKLRLQNYLEGRSTEDLRPELVCMDNRCDLGKWLHGPGQQRLGRYPAFGVLVARHKLFHMKASNVVALTQARQLDQARSELDGPYRHASSQVVLLLKELKRGLMLR